MSDKNHTVFPVVERDALKEFPNCRVVDFLIDEFTRLEDCFGDITLFVSPAFSFQVNRPNPL